MEVRGVCGQDPQSRGLSVTDQIKKKRGSFSEDKRKIGGHLVRTIKKKEGVLVKPSVFSKKRESFSEAFNPKLVQH